MSLGQEVTLRCIVKGHPAPKITWLLKKEEVLSDSDDFKISQISSGSELTIKRVVADQNFFVCEAQNILGRNSQSFHLDVVTATKIQSGPESKTAQVLYKILHDNCYNSPLSLVLGRFYRCQFHQHFTHSFFVQKFLVKLFSICILRLNFLEQEY